MSVLAKDSVVIGMDPHKRSVTIEVMAGDETILGGGRFATDVEGFTAMRAYVAQWKRRVWAIEGCAGIGGHVAERLSKSGEDVVDVPPKLSARARVFISESVSLIWPHPDGSDSSDRRNTDVVEVVVDQGDAGLVRRRSPGPAPLVAQREQFARLIGRGVSNAQACRIVGVHRRTGTRWLYGRSIPTRDGSARHYPPMITEPKAPQPSSGRYLSVDERSTIAEGRRQGRTMTAIALELGRSVSTVSRELARNADAAGRYSAVTAHRAALARLARPRPRKVASDPVLAAVVQGWLDVRWSPEQISAALAQTFADDPGRRLSTETIYQALYASDAVLQRDPATCLRSGRRRRRPHRRTNRRRAHPDTRPSIRERPAEADGRLVPGHWEGDLITGRANRSAIATVVDRCTGFTILVHLPGRHTAEVTRQALTDTFTRLPASLRRSLTWDCGTEMADHAAFTTATGVGVYFADPHSPWQRGSNENVNGLLRQYFPKGTNLAVHAPQRLTDVMAELNARPRKRHAWASPSERLAALQSLHE